MTKKTKSNKGASPRGPAPAATDRLPGMETEVIPELEAAAVDYAGVRDQRMELTKVEVDRKDGLLLLMKSNGLDRYDNNGVHIRLSLAANVKVRVQKGE
jgi:hypothetical protein